MKIAFIVRPTEEVDLMSPSGISVISYQLVKELSKREEIELIDVYGVGKNYFNNDNKINFISVLPLPVRQFIKEDDIFRSLQNYSEADLKNTVIESLNIKISKLIHEKDYDLIHDNSTYPIYGSFSSFLKASVLTTIHTSINSESVLIPSKMNIFNKENNHFFVCISDYQRQKVKELGLDIDVVGRVYNGIDVSRISSSDEIKRENCMWIGRITQADNKGAKEALQVVNKLGKKLNLISCAIDNSFFDTIKHLVTEQITMITEDIDINAKFDYYRNSACLLYPLMWEEPFGLVFLEAMACGTPIVAYARGSVPEVIKDGETGFIVNSTPDDIRGDFIVKKTGIEGLCEAVNRMYAMSEEEYRQMRRNCRRHVDENFTVEKMVDEYEKVYEGILSNGKGKK